MVRSFEIAGRTIGPGNPCFIIAEAGVNHNGNPELAERLLVLAAEAGVDAVKFQTFNPALVVASGAGKVEYQTRTTRADESQLEMLAGLVLSDEAHASLMKRASELGVVFLSTPFDDERAHFLQELGVRAYKISSGDLTNLPFLAQLARRGLPMLVSTGMASIQEVEAALATIRDNGDPAVGLFHCVSNYPTAPSECNLRAMESLRREFRFPVGWSDHTDGIEIAIAAVALGADLIEKHFTLDRNLPGPDHRSSLEPDELRAMVTGIRKVTAALGSGDKQPVDAEFAMAAAARRSLHWARAMLPGTVVAASDIVVLRPGTGIPPSRLHEILGRVLSRKVSAGSMVAEEDFGET